MKISRQGVLWKIAQKGMSGWDSYKHVEHSEPFDSCTLFRWLAKGTFRILMLGVVAFLALVIVLFVLPKVGAGVWGIAYSIDTYFISLLAGISLIVGVLGSAGLCAFVMATLHKIKGNIVIYRETKAVFKAKAGKYCTKVELTDG